jgi:hypothetical protein
MPRWNPAQLSSTLLRQQAEGDLAMQEANRQKVMQEVFDLSVDNEIQTTVAKEMLSPESRAMRKAGTKAQTAESEASTAKSWMVMRDTQHELAETAFAAYNADPSQQSYDVTREMLVEANPHLEELLPETWSKDAGNTLVKVQRSWLNNKTHRQEMEKAGFDQSTQYEMLRRKMANDSKMLDKEYTLRTKQMEKEWNRKDYHMAYGEEAAAARARWAASPYTQLAEEYRREGDPAMALRMLQRAVEAEDAIAAAKAAGAGGDAILDAKRMQEMTHARSTQLNKLLIRDYGNMADVGFDKKTKTFKASNGPAVSEALFKKAQEFKIPMSEQAAWATERMIIWPDENRWLELPLDDQGLPLDGIPASEIRALVGTTQPDLNPGRWNQTENINDMDEALHYYNEVMKHNYGDDAGILKRDYTL